MAIAQSIKAHMEQGSWIRKMFEEGIALKKKLGEDKVFDLSLGNPVIDPPAEFDEELRRIAANPTPGSHRYMPNAGYPETRAAVAASLASETGLPFTGGEVVMACGAGGALNVVCKTLLERGDEVVAFAPYFVEYVYYADNHGGVCKVVPFTKGFLPDIAAFERSITAKTRIVLIGSPNNPTGVVYPRETLERIGQIIQRKEREYGREIWLVSDEPYRKILFDGLEYPHIFGVHAHSIVATSHSKDLALPGERI
ncbi:MAG: aminotransferase class I/II-fold pyridoxal phosphate-dependent enzyme, partial [Chloroflexi bacterium]|nr:aminotransferase class I/II-fold pyridoxal phosphate-dependent enzyme [Chloroflexota bacterium]